MIIRPRAIGAIIRKDFFSLWHVALAQAALIVGWTALNMWEPVKPLYLGLRIIGLAPLMLLTIVASLVVIVMAVQQDPALGPRHDWRTRPVNRLDLLAAKYMFILAAVIAPWLASGIAHDIAAHYSASEMVLSYLSLWPLLLLVPLVMALAATAETLLGFLVVAAASIALALGAGFLTRDVIIAPLGLALAAPLTSWLSSEILAWLLVVLGFVILWLEFTRHRVWLSRGAFALGVFAIVTLVAYVTPFNAVWAAYVDKPETAATRGITASLDKLCLTTTVDARDTGIGDLYFGEKTPPKGVGAGWLVFAGLQSDQRLVIENAETDLGPTGAGAGAAQIWTTRKGVIIPTPRDDMSRTNFSYGVNAEKLRAIAAGGATLRVKYLLTLLQETSRHEFPIDGKRHAIAGFGWCSAKAPEQGAAYDVDCFKTGAPPDLVRFALAGQPSTCTGCTVDYEPSMFEFPGGERRATRVVQTGPMPHPLARTAEVVTYRAVSRFEREATAPVPAPGPGECFTLYPGLSMPPPVPGTPAKTTFTVSVGSSKT